MQPDDVTWPTYVEEALKTADPHQTPERRLAQGALGLVGEVFGELTRASHDLEGGEVREELGDCFWYTALIHDALAQLQSSAPLWHPLDPIQATDLTWHILERRLGKLANAAEKVADQGRGDDEILAAAGNAYDSICAQLAAPYDDETLRAILADNISKLRARHGDSAPQEG